MKIKTSELTGPAFHWAVAKAEGLSVHMGDWYGPFGDNVQLKVGRDDSGRIDCLAWLHGPRFDPSTDWALGGPIIERERIVLDYYNHICDGDDQVHARLSRAKLKPDKSASWYAPKRGPTILVAAMRCFVASKMGDEVDVPEELLP